MPEFSVIVPVYWAEQYLSRCIESILNQTVVDFELILVDDGSPDNSAMICDDYAAKDSRILVIHQQNGGVSAARNAGLQAASGQYVVFVDSDDEVDPNYLECMQGYDVDLVIAGISSYDVGGTLLHKMNLPHKKVENLTTEDACQNAAYHALDYPVAKRYSLDNIRKNKITFQLGLQLGEDAVFFAEYLGISTSLQYISATPYRYYKYGTTTLSSFTEDNLQRQLAANQMVGAVLERYYPGVLESDIWKRRNWSIIYGSIFYILREWDASFSVKCRTLQSYFSMPEYQEFVSLLDCYMQDDTALWRKLLRCKNAALLILVWKMTLFRRMLGGRKSGR